MIKLTADKKDIYFNVEHIKVVSHRVRQDSSKPHDDTSNDRNAAWVTVGGHEDMMFGVDETVEQVIEAINIWLGERYS